MDLATLARFMPGIAKAAEPGGQFDAIGTEWRGFRQDVRRLADAQEQTNALLARILDALASNPQAGHDATAATGDNTQ